MKWAKFLGAVFIFALILFNPEQAVSNAQRAMYVWYSSVAPALFPFLALMPLLSSKEACMAYEKLFDKWMRPLFRLPGSAAPAVIVGMIAGSPGGAIALRNIASNANLSRSETRRIALAVGGVSPAYLIIGVGQRMWGSSSWGICMAIAQALIQLLMLVMLPENRKDNEVGCVFSNCNLENRIPMSMAVENILGICGYMVFYSVIAGLLANIIGKDLGKIILLIMDLPSGLDALINSPIRMKSMLMGAAIGFTGLCIIFQNMNTLKELNIRFRDYIGIRIVFSLFLAGVGFIMQGETGVSAIKMLEGTRISYSISLLMVGIFVLPGLYLLSNKLFLNKRKF